MKRSEAKAQGLKFYSTGKPCKYGHLSDRYTTTYICVECAKIASIDSYKNNKDMKYASWRKWYESNKDIHHARSKKWQKANLDKVYKNAKLWALNNPEKIKNKRDKYNKKNPDKYTAWAVAGVARRAKRIPTWLTTEDKWMLKEAYALAKQRTKLFGFVWEVDHIIPLRGVNVSGLHVPLNVQVIPKTLNRLKRNVYHPV
jgi:hypothetical protein